MKGNELKYTSLTVDDIVRQVNERFLKLPDGETDHKFDTFRESAIAQTLIEIFAGVVDINNYYIQRRAEECFYDTAQLKSSVISLSRMFGYVMNRREPSRAQIRIIIDGDIGDNQIQIPYYSKFSYGGNPYVLVNTMTYRIPDSIYKNMSDDSEIVIDADSFGNSIDIVQGEIKEKVFNGTSNSQINAPFQIYKIEDKTFSNIYGPDKDFFFNDVTQVYVGESKTDETRFDIDRRSLLNWETINTANLTQSQSVCVIRTTPDGFVEILFGDGDPSGENNRNTPDATGGFARKGAITRKDNIYVQYLSCEGKKTNKYGVIGDKVDFSGKLYNSKGDDITNKVSFELISNVYGGADDESMDSIKYSSPKIYYSLDRLVSKDDYLAYLKSLTTPINVKNAVAWGEQEERDRYRKFAMVKMYNTILFTLAGSLYNFVTDDTTGEIISSNAKIGNQYEEVVLDLNYNPYKFQTQGYFNIFVTQEMVNQLNRYSVNETFKEISGNLLGEVADGGSITYKSITDIADEVKSAINTNFPSGEAVINFNYTSDEHEYVSNIKMSGSVKVKGLKDTSLLEKGGKDYLDGIADRINDAFIGTPFKDNRGNKVDNENFNKQAFYGRWGYQEEGYPTNTEFKLVKFDDWDDDNVNAYSFRFRFNDIEKDSINKQSPCYISNIDEDVSTLAGILGFNGKYVYDANGTVQNNEMNGKISQVVKDLSNRSQVNVKNIYVSPIIHRFYLTGDIYIKPLYDKIEVRREITNALYEWLDINADFNQPIYMSNITEIVESNAGVVNSNLRLVPEDITAGENNVTNLWYDPNPNTNNIYKKYQTRQDPLDPNSDPIDGNPNPIAKLINDVLYSYINDKPVYEYPTYQNWYRRFFGYDIEGTDLEGNEDTSSGYRQTVLEGLYYVNRNHINERTFYDTFAGRVYKEILNRIENDNCSGDGYICSETGLPNYARFIGRTGTDNYSYNSDVVHDSVVRTDFAVIMENIRKDLSYIIMDNMIDTNGNIDAEYNSNNEYVKGGYSLGSEITQIILDPNVNTELNFRYK